LGLWSYIRDVLTGDLGYVSRLPGGVPEDEEGGEHACIILFICEQRVHVLRDGKDVPSHDMTLMMGRIYAQRRNDPRIALMLGAVSPPTNVQMLFFFVTRIGGLVFVHSDTAWSDGVLDCHD
jgi:hypothetical protein